MKMSIVAKLDMKSRTSKCLHYTIGKVGDKVSGGFYIDREMKFPPDFIEIEVPTRDLNEIAPCTEELQELQELQEEDEEGEEGCLDLE